MVILWIKAMWLIPLSCRPIVVDKPLYYHSLALLFLFSETCGQVVTFRRQSAVTKVVHIRLFPLWSFVHPH